MSKLSNLDLRWTLNLDEGAKDKRLRAILGSKEVLDILRGIVKDQMDTKQKTREADYNSGSWAFMQADRNGYIRALEDVLKLIPRPE